MKNLPLRVWAYALTLASLSGGVVALLVRRGDPLDGGQIAGFGILVILAELAPVSMPHVTYSVGFIVVISAIIVAGPAVAAIAACLAALDLGLRERPDWLGRLIFNGAQFSLSTAVAGVTYEGLGGPVGQLTASDFPEVLLPILAATVAFFVVNSLAVSSMVVLSRNVPWRDVLHSDYRRTSISYFSFAAFGVTLAVLHLQMGWVSTVFVLVPLIIARNALQATGRMEVQFEATLKTLITAIEAKDLYTRGHAERVSRLATMVAREYGLPEPRIRRIRYAALMHDVGKLAVSTKILQKPGKLTPEEYEHMKIHPIHGSEIVAEIDLLADMVDGVRHHHERMDGKGYPDGLGGDDLSLPARIIMVADAFDSMTSTRTYRRALQMEKAMGELRRCQDTQFAREAIDALERAIAKHGWQPMPEEYCGEQTPRPAASAHALA